MPKVLCKLRNAGEEINDVKFTKTDGGMLSEDVSAEVAANFAQIEGYEVVEDGKGQAKTAEKNKSGEAK